MADQAIARVTTLGFDVFGTVLDLSASLVPPIDDFLARQGVLARRGAGIDGASFWVDWRGRQRIEQYQDNLLMLGHGGYLETCRRALVYCLKLHRVEFTSEDVARLMQAYQNLQPYPDALTGLRRLAPHYSLVALSNGERQTLEHLAAGRIGVPFDEIISVEPVGVFKPHPAVYRRAALDLGKEPGEIMMVAAHSFDVLGARSCGFRGAYVNRYGLPTEESAYQPDLEVQDFIELADRLLSNRFLSNRPPSN